MNLFKSYILTLAIFLLPAIATASSADGKAMEGMELYREQAFDKASQKFLEARKEKPDDPKISYNLGNSRYKQGKFDEALQDYSRSVNEKSDPALIQKSTYNMGNTLFRMGKLEESVASYKKALELDPSDMDTKYNLEFVREQIEKKKQEQQQKQDESGKDKKDQQSGDEKDKNKEQNENDPQEQNESQDDPSRTAEASPENMTEEEVEQRLSALTEDLKKFQRQQALDMKSLFTYQGNDW